MLRERLWASSSYLTIGGAILAATVVLATTARAADDPIDLDGKASNGQESVVRTRVIQTFPVEVENVIFNNTPNRFDVAWEGAGPGGLWTHVNEGPDVGTRWTWTTLEAVYTISSPATFAPKQSIVINPLGLPVYGMPTGGLHVPPAPVGGGSFVVTGKSETQTGVTTSAADLLSSLITFFSPPKLIAQCGGSIGGGVINTSFTAGASTTISASEGDCCPAPGMIICNGECYDYKHDADNCGGCGITCDEGDYCYEGVCRDWCPAPKPPCGETCVDMNEDPLNCGACGHACGTDEICSDGVCTGCAEGLSACGSECLDLSHDPSNCGMCGNVCQCPGGVGTASCNAGQCVIDPAHNDCTAGPAARSVVDFTFDDSAGALLASTGRTDVGRLARNVPRGRAAIGVPARRLDASGAGPVQRGEIPLVPARVCSVPPTPPITLEPGQTYNQCRTGSILGRQVTQTATFVVDGQTYQGPCPTIVPAPEVAIPPFYPKPGSFFVEDESGDGLIQPGEHVCLTTAIQNLGLGQFIDPVGVLTSDPDENNPLAITIDTDTSSFDSFPAFAGGGTCEEPAAPATRSNHTQYCFTLPEDQEPDVARWYDIAFHEQDHPENEVHTRFALGVGRICRPDDHELGAYDEVQGLLPPFSAKLLPENDPVCNFASSSFGVGSTTPIKLRLACGSKVLRPEDFEFTPRLFYLHRLSDGFNVPLDWLDGENGANPIDPALVCSGNRCEYEIRNDLLTPDSYELGIQMPDGRTFKACFNTNG